ncbi:MAG: 3-phosphoshikimate 1-carboxyvinyltransferase [Alphaproteobacteria bacterium]
MAMQLISDQATPLKGRIEVPGDKSVSHRALMIGAVAVGETRIEGLLEGEDVLHTAAALRALGAEIERDGDGVYRIHGTGIGGLRAPASVLDLGNSGTGARLLIGLLASHPFTSHITGDASLSARPMGRITTPLKEMGARFVGQGGGCLPLAVIGAEAPIPITYRLPVASAQVKSAILLAGLNTPGQTTVIEPQPTRDHSEIMMRYFGVDIAVEDIEGEDGARAITVTGQPEIAGRHLHIAGDPSSAAFPAVAAALVPGSEITLGHIGINPLRMGLYETLREMGADLSVDATDANAAGGEPTADITIRAGALRGVDVPAARAPSMIDEYPILAVAAACAEGTTTLRGLAELRLKESDRIAAIAAGLKACGVKVTEDADSLVIVGAGGPPPGGGNVASLFDHRIAMAFLVLGMAASSPVSVDDGTAIATSFPGFVELMNGLGGRIHQPAGAEARA